MNRVKPVWANPALLGFSCPACGREAELDEGQPTCAACSKPLLARYDLPTIARRARRDALPRGPGLWRYRAVLPFAEDHPILSLGEGGTPLLPLPRLARAAGLAHLWLKEESGNPTQSFKARGLCLAVNAATAMGKTAVALPSAGNAGSAAAAYAAAAGMGCRITVPEETPDAFIVEQEALGAEVLRVPGTIADAGRALAGFAPPSEYWNVATFKEPFRVEGKKTLGYEIAEQLEWTLPDVVLYPTGGGTGLVGMWLAWNELRALGWTDGRFPRLVSVQVEGCAPVVRAFDEDRPRIAPWEDARTLASGLRVPSPFADELILRSIRETGGRAIAVGEEEMLRGMATLAREEGCFACPEGGATWAALEKLRGLGEIDDRERVVLFNTGSGLKYLEAWRVARENGRTS